MKVLIIYAHPNPMSFTKAILDNFVRGLKKQDINMKLSICTK